MKASKPPKIAVISVAAGLLLMSVFTTMWASLAWLGLPSATGSAIVLIAGVLSLAMIGHAIHLLANLSRFPKSTSAADKARGKKTGIAYGVVFGTEGITIGAASGILISRGLTDFIIPVSALIVGLHFYPMAKVFQRTLDYYLATWVCLVAIAGLYVMLTTNVAAPAVWSGVGLGVALATTAYGVYMIHMKQRFLAR